MWASPIFGSSCLSHCDRNTRQKTVLKMRICFSLRFENVLSIVRGGCGGESPIAHTWADRTTLLAFFFLFCSVWAPQSTGWCCSSFTCPRPLLRPAVFWNSPLLCQTSGESTGMFRGVSPGLFYIQLSWQRRVTEDEVILVYALIKDEAIILGSSLSLSPGVTDASKFNSIRILRATHCHLLWQNGPNVTVKHSSLSLSIKELCILYATRHRGRAQSQGS